MPDRYIEFAGGRKPLEWSGVVDGPRVRLVDEWQDVAVEIEARGASQLWISPIETVSESEEGFERVYQGSQILGVWNATLESHGTLERGNGPTCIGGAKRLSGVAFSSTDFSLWGSVSKPGLFPRAKIDEPHITENSRKSKISTSSNGTPQTEVCATWNHSAISRLSAKGHSVSIHCESQRKPLRAAIAEISSARYLCELSVQMVSSFKNETLHPERGIVTV